MITGRKTRSGGIELSHEGETIRVGVARRRHGHWCRLVYDGETGRTLGVIRHMAAGWIARKAGSDTVHGRWSGPGADRDAAASLAGWL